MSILQFIASLVNSLAWPLVALAIAILFRRQFAQILLKISRFKYKDVEIEFRRELEIATEEAEKIDVRPSLPTPTVRPEQQESDDLLGEASRLAAEFPEPAVAVAGGGVEHELMRSVLRLAISPDYPPYNSALKNIGILADYGAIDSATVDLLNRMRHLRNLAVHRSAGGGPISADEAREFIALAKGIVDRLKQLNR